MGALQVGAGPSALCADVGCDPTKHTAGDHAPLDLKTCDGSLGQQWTHLKADNSFQSKCGYGSASGKGCLDLFGGGSSDSAGLYQCSPPPLGIWNQRCDLSLMLLPPSTQL